MTATIPGELTFEAKDATEFRALLGRILKGTPLTCSQIAIKTGMARSTAYSLPNIKRPGLPSNPQQVHAFVEACGLSATQTALVMDLWGKLQRDAENARVASENAEGGTSAPAVPQPDWTELLLHGPDSFGVNGDQVFTLNTCSQCSQDDDFRPRRSAGWGRKPSFHRDTSWTELLQYVLANEERSRRAVSLLRMITLLVVVIVIALVFLAVQQPSLTPIIVGCLVGPFVLLKRRSTKPTRKKS